MESIPSKPPTYEEVPYLGSSIALTHPDHQSVVARLRGLPTQSVEQCRVLELGCGLGFNLIDMAQLLPGSSFLGIDLSPRQIANGVEIVGKLGLKNIELRCQDVMEFKDEGSFDYIIVHGLYSWVPKPVRDQIVEICRRDLSSNGTAYISYNTLPGWHLKNVARDLMRYHAQRRSSVDPTTQLVQIREFFAQAAGLPSGRPGYLAVIKEVSKHLTESPDWHLRHDEMGEVNDPIYFEQFIHHIEAHGLKHVAPASPSMEMLRWLPPAQQAMLRSFTSSELEREQYLDFMTGPTFRSSIVCRAEAMSQRDQGNSVGQGVESAEDRVAIAALGGMFVAGRFEEVSGATPGSAAFINTARRSRLEVPDVQLAALFRRVTSAWPRVVPLADFLNVSGDATVAASMIDALAYQVLSAYRMGVLELWSRSTDFMADVKTERPRISPLLRYQLGANGPAVNLRHDPVTVNDSTRRLLLLLDGTRDRNSLRKELVRLADRLEWKPADTTGSVAKTDLYDYVPRTLSNLLSHSLLLVG